MLAIKPNETYLDFGSDKNDVFVLKKNAAGTEMRFKCLEAKKKPAALHGCRLTLSARRAGETGAPAIKDAPCALDENQFDNPGIGVFVFDETTSKLPAGDYELEIKATNEDGSLARYFPSNQAAAFARLIVHDSIS